MDQKTILCCGQYQIELKPTEDGFDASIILDKRCLYTCTMLYFGIETHSPEGIYGGAYQAMSNFARESELFDEHFAERTMHGWNIRFPKHKRVLF